MIAECPIEQRYERASLKAPLEATSDNPFFDQERIHQALNWIDPRPYKTWLDTALFLKAAYGDESFELWPDWGNSAPKDVLEGNVGNYAPELIWSTIEPFLEPGIGAGALFKTARGEADKVVAGHKIPKLDAVRKRGRWLFNETPQKFFLHKIRNE